MPSVERRRAGPGTVSKDRENTLEIRSRRRLYCQWENDYPEDNSITIVPLHCYSPPVRAGDSVGVLFLDFPFDYRGILRRVTSAGDAPEIWRKNPGVLAHTKIASNCGLTRYFLVFAPQSLIPLLRKNVRSREIIRTTGNIFEIELGVAFLRDNNLNNEFTLLNISLSKI